MSTTIALLTDFGTTDTYVGVMKAVMARICPVAQFIDLTHEIVPQNVTQAAFMLHRTYRHFPPGTVFLIVVDPGVGSQRRAIAARAGAYTFVAPDNGVLSLTINGEERAAIVQLTNPAYQLTPVSSTFHGRDIFAPAAAHLAAGVPLEQFGSIPSSIVQLPPSNLKIENGRIIGQILYTDHFGNIITNIGELQWLDNDRLQIQYHSNTAPGHITAQTATVTINNYTFRAIHHFYGEVDQGEPLALVDSSGYLEIAVSGGSAATQLNVSPGDQVILETGT